MPVIEVPKKAFLKAVGRPETMTNAEIEDFCGEFGIEVDKFLDETGTMKLEIAANRYDLCGFEGVVRSFRVFFGLEQSPVYRTLPSQSQYRITVEPEVAQIRPFVVSAILRGITFTPEVYESFIGLQEKLHENACRRRALVAIGTHDLALTHPPFFYRARAPASIEFEPLHVGGEALCVMRADRMLEHFADPKVNSHLRPFVPLIQSSPVYPIVCDSSEGLGVLSLPPIINSERSKIRPQRTDSQGHVVDAGTRDVFVECTATDLTRAKIVLNTLVTNFYQYCAGGVEQVEVVYPGGKPAVVVPDLNTWTLETSADYMTRAIGVPLDTQSVVGYLNRMQHRARAEGERILVEVPPTRSDVMHECDLMEDVAIAYGFKNITKAAAIPPMQTVGGVLPDREMTELVRQEIACCGFTEVATFALVAHDDNFTWLQRPDDGTACAIANPKTHDFEVCRTSLLPCMLRTVASNMAHPKPLRIFEVSEVVLRDRAVDTGARNELRLCALNCAPTPGFEVVHGLLDALMLRFGVTCAVSGAPAAAASSSAPAPAPAGPTYQLVPCDDGALIEGQRAAVVLSRPATADRPATRETIGVIGVVHPRVLDRFEVSEPCAIVEIQIGKLYNVPFPFI